MRRARALVWTMACVGLLWPVPTAAQKRAMTAQDVLALKDVSAPSLSPDGSRVLFVVREAEVPRGMDDRRDMRSHLWLATADGTDAPRQITFGERGESSPAWSPDGAWISFVAARGEGTPAPGEGADEGPKSQVWLMPAGGGEAFRLTDAKDGVGAHAWSKDGRHIAYLARDPLPKDVDDKRKRRDDARVFERDFQQTHIWTIEVATKQATRITEGADFTVVGLSWAPDGTRIAFSSKPTPLIRDYRTDVSVVTLGSKAITRIAVTSAAESAPAWSPDGSTIAYLAETNDAKPNADGIAVSPLGNDRLILYDVAAGRMRDASSREFDLQAGSPVWTPDSRRILLNTGVRVARDVFAFDVGTGRYARLTTGKVIGFGNQSRDGSKVAFVMSGPEASNDVYVADASFTAPRRVSNANPQLAEFALGTTEVVTWKGHDGLEVEGILLKPTGYEPGRRVPLLVEVHGGPTGAFVNNFKDSGQMWAGAGWAVLYPNPRGSTNYGERFMRGNVEDWGVGDYKDIMAGVDAVVAKGVADPEKLAVMGWSYGGYMTCWIVSQTTRFKAAMMGAGLSNLYSMYGTTDIPGYMGTFFRNYPTAENLPLYLERSGLTYVDKVATPLLILHGSNDERVPIGQPMEFYRALKDRGKTVELVFYPREGHGLQEYYHRLDRLQRQFDWITRHTVGEGPGKTSSQ